MYNDMNAIRREVQKLAPIAQIEFALPAGSRPTITYQESASEQQRQAVEALLDGWIDPISPEWDDFLSNFRFPGNPLYQSVVTKVAAAGFVVQDHWRNFLMVVDQRKIDLMEGSIRYLEQLLSDAGHPLSSDDIVAWNNLMDAYNFPESCKF